MQVLSALLPFQLVNLVHRSAVLGLRCQPLLHSRGITMPRRSIITALHGGSYLSVMPSSGASRRVVKVSTDRDTCTRSSLVASTRRVSKSTRINSRSQEQSREGDKIASEEALVDMTVAQLKDRLRSQGLRVSGSKRELVNRLLQETQGDWLTLLKHLNPDLFYMS